MDGNGEIDFAEWCTVAIDKTEDLLNGQSIKAAFEVFVGDYDTEITAAGIGKTLGNSLSTKEDLWKEVIKEMDIKGHGKIDLDEFEFMMLKINAALQ